MRYLVAGIEVEATLTAGGGFYEVTVIPTGHKLRVGAKGFDMVAVPYLNFSDKVIAVIQDEIIVEEKDGASKI